MISSKKQLQNNVLDVAKTIEGLNTFEDYIKCKVLEIVYKTTESLEFLGAELLVAYGGPTVAVNTQTNTVKGSWALDNYEVAYTNPDLENHLELKYIKQMNSLLATDSTRRIK